LITWVDDSLPLPPASTALGPDSEVPGLVAAGGRLSTERLEEAYRAGIFPWFSAGQPVLWWSPDPRMVLHTAEFHLSELRFDSDFETLIRACASTPREGQDGTWIVPSMVAAYTAWHRQGRVHSVETWVDGEMVGGLYFINIGRMCFGESMFSRRTDASKIALAAFVAACLARGVDLIDCQQNTGHLASLGGREITRAAFLEHLARGIAAEEVAPWTYDEEAWALLEPPATENTT